MRHPSPHSAAAPASTPHGRVPERRRNPRGLGVSVLGAALVTLMAIIPRTANAQGYVLFANLSQDLTVEKPIYNAATGQLLGSGFVAQLFAGRTGTRVDELVAVDSPVNFLDLPNPTGLFVGPQIVIPGLHAGDAASLEVRAWRREYATWTVASAVARTHADAPVGRSGVFQLVLGTQQAPAETAFRMPQFALAAVPEPAMAPLLVTALWLGGFCFRRQGCPR